MSNLEPPPQQPKFNWIWQKWLFVLHDKWTKPVVTIVEDADMSNSWVNFDADRKARYWIGPDNVVHLAGRIKSGTVTSAAFTLPYVPIAPAASFAVSSNGAFGELVIDSAGGVVPNVGSNTYFSLEGVSFTAQ